MSSIPLDTYIQIATLVVATATFIIAQAVQRNRDRAVARRGIYEKLELASIELFRFEADHIELIRPVWEEKTPLPHKGTAEYMATLNYVCQMLNLFELSIQFRKDGTMPEDVFSSWMAWMFMVVKAPGFPELWEDARSNYLPRLRNIMDGGIRIVDAEPDPVIQENQFNQYLAFLLKIELPDPNAHQANADPLKAFLKTQNHRTTKPPVQPEVVDIRLGGDISYGKELAAMFIRNVGVQYISHGELMEGRAISPQAWAPDLEARLTIEFEKALLHKPLEISNMVTAYIQNQLVGFVLLEFETSSAGKYALLSDIVVEKKHRHLHIGEHLLRWTSNMLKENQIENLFAESNISNTVAHRFLEKNGFVTISKVFRKVTSQV